MVMPFDPALHESGSVSARGVCTWSDHQEPARWSVVWHGKRYAACDQDLVAFAKWELPGSDRDQTAPTAQ